MILHDRGLALLCHIRQECALDPQEPDRWAALCPITVKSNYDMRLSMEQGPIKFKNIHIRQDSAPRDPNRHALRRFMRYVWPYTPTLALAVLCGILKFILPCTMALSLKYLIDRLDPAKLAQSHSTKTDAVAHLLDRYTMWMSGELPAKWQGVPGTFWTPFNVLMVSLVVLYAIWGVSLFYRSYLRAVGRDIA